jgi:anti-anti-sigma factor
MRQGHRTDHLTAPRHDIRDAGRAPAPRDDTHEAGHPPVVREIDDSVVVELGGEVDILTLHRMTPLLDTVAAGPYRVVAVDLTAVTFLDCSGLTLLVRASRRTRARGARTTVICAHPLTLRLITLADLTDTLTPVPTLTEALAR